MIFFKQMYDDMFNFSVEDLKTNSLGSMTEKQRRGFHFYIYRFLVIGLPLGIIFSLIVTVYVFNLAFPAYTSLTIRTPILVIMGVFLCGFYGYLIIYWGRLRSDFEQNIVLSVSGSVSVNKEAITIDDVTFRTQLAGWFQEDKNYRVYYLPKSKVILSVEEFP